MTDFDEPTNTSLYSGVLATLRGLIASCAKMDFSSDTNVPSGAIRFNTTNKLLESWNGTSWTEAWPLVQTWTPTYGATSPMTFTSVTTNAAYYVNLGRLVFFNLAATGTTGGTATNQITFTLPSAPATAGAAAWSATILDAGITGNVLTGHAFSFTGNTCWVFPYNNADFTLGSGRQIWVQGFYVR